ncbi:hypothetical protein CesoFtcFv8_019664 [Champsocephalus esox]|uniref:Pentraxin (PTX) domain-containing protein n=1 Tax=Champsocephalus esox TaxID=159716 RepID=A0AAN8BDN5_9TELE|nr:hypothetical protein CesoFtcFv8_019664 [Champsocephalus esox]
MARDVSPLSLRPLSARQQKWLGPSLGCILPFFPRRLLIVYFFLSCAVAATGSLPGIEYDYGISPKFVCTPIPPEADPSCYSPPSVPHGPSNNGNTNGHNGSSRRGMMSDEAKATILHLRESLVRQKETILDQRETIRELTAKLTLCETFGGHHGTDHHENRHDNHHDTHDNHHDDHHDDHHGPHSTHHTPSSSHHGTYHPSDHHYPHGRSDPHRSDPHSRKGISYGKHSSFSPEQTGKTLQTLKERLESLQARNSSSSYSSSLRELLQRKITALEEQLHSYYRDHHDDRHDDHHDDNHGSSHTEDHHDDHHGLPSSSKETTLRGTGHSKLEAVLNKLHHGNTDLANGKKLKSPSAFMLDFPMKTNYMYARMKRAVVNEVFAMTICLWLKAGEGPGLGTPLSYAVPGQANELVLIKWGTNPMELLINDKAVTLPISMTDGKWHHLCVTWTTRDGVWEAYQDGVKKGSGQNLSGWQPIKSGGTFILGQEQDTMGGRFDVTQSFMGGMSDLQFWSRVLTSNEIHTQATCAGHLVGDVMSWSEESVELHGGLAKLPFEPCH